MHHFTIFYAPLLVVFLAIIFSFFIANKSTKYED